MRRLTYNIAEQSTVARFLRGQGYSGGILTMLRKSPEYLLVNGKSAFTTAALQPGDKLTVTIAESGSYRAEPREIPLDVVYEDEDILVLKKPSGMFAMPHAGAELDLFSALAFRYGGNETPHVVTRLDRDTSGLMLIARHALAHSLLSGGGITRRYRGIATGLVEPPEGVIDVPIARCCGQGSMRRCVDKERGQRAVTKYRTVERGGENTLFEAELLTGRTHQIRVHFAYLGYPLAGDRLYGGDCRGRNTTALHACYLEFLHPMTRECMRFESEPEF